MSKLDPIQQAMDRLGELRHTDASDLVVEEVRGFLRSRSNLVVAKAAKVASELKITSLTPDLLAAFDRLMADAPRLDKRCAAVTEIIAALYELDYDQPEPYLTGLKHFQPEASFGPPVDAAAQLRGLSAQGLLRTRFPDALTEVVPLLVDREPAARVGAIRALAANGGEAGVLLLRLKVLTGDIEPGVLGKCFVGLLAASPDRSISFVAGYIDSEDSSMAEAAILALGESRRQPAFEILKEKWGRSACKPLKEILLVSMASSRLEEAIAFLLSLLTTASVHTATDVLGALAIYKQSERVSESVREVLARRGDKTLLERFVREFDNRV